MTGSCGHVSCSSSSNGTGVCPAGVWNSTKCRLHGPNRPQSLLGGICEHASILRGNLVPATRRRYHNPQVIPLCLPSENVSPPNCGAGSRRAPRNVSRDLPSERLDARGCWLGMKPVQTEPELTWPTGRRAADRRMGFADWRQASSKTKQAKSEARACVPGRA